VRKKTYRAHKEKTLSCKNFAALHVYLEKTASKKTHREHKEKTLSVKTL
jgi:hypothetical protein